MTDHKRKGILLWCDTCGKKTRFIPEGSADDVVFLQCNVCGEGNNMIDRWGRGDSDRTHRVRKRDSLRQIEEHKLYIDDYRMIG